MRNYRIDKKQNLINYENELLIEKMKVRDIIETEIKNRKIDLK